jgi:hypothetical protein
MGDSCSAIRDVGGFLIRLADQSEEKSASLSTAVVRNYEFYDARPTLANPFLSVVTARYVAALLI